MKDIFQVLKEHNYQTRLVYPTKLFFLIEGELKASHNKQNLKKFTTSKPGLQKTLKSTVTHRRRN
jgi:hypothetical protein